MKKKTYGNKNCKFLYPQLKTVPMILFVFCFNILFVYIYLKVFAQ
jgi:hypothetical protein